MPPVKRTNNRKSRSKITTVNDLLARDDVNDMLSRLDKEKPDIQDIIVITVDRKTQKYTVDYNDDILESRAVWLLERVKLDIMKGEDE